MTTVINVATFNILDPVFAERHTTQPGVDLNGKSNWNERQHQVNQLITQATTEFDLHIICLQEVSRNSLNDLKETITQLGYKSEYTQHPVGSDGIAILYKKHRFIEKNFQSLSCHNKSSCYLDLQETTGKIIRVANCHLTGGREQQLGANQINQLVEEMKKTSADVDVQIIMGDFNSNGYYRSPQGLIKDEIKFNALKQEQYINDGNLDPTEPSTGRHIDWIWANKPESSILQLIPIKTSHLPQVSDHLLLATKVVFKKQDSISPQVASPTPFHHRQPHGSFRAYIMNYLCNSEQRGNGVPSLNPIYIKLDEILTKHANTKGFVISVRNEFFAYVESLSLSGASKLSLKNDFENAVKIAQQSKPIIIKLAQPPIPQPIHQNVNPLTTKTLTVETQTNHHFIKRIYDAFLNFFCFIGRLLGMKL